MSQKRTSTDHLVGIIHSIQTKQQDGFLRVWRGNGLILEEGNITFANGQVMQAHAGWRDGSEALKWLCTWQKCDFIFEPATPSSGVTTPPDQAEGTLVDEGLLPRPSPLEKPVTKKRPESQAWKKVEKKEVGPSKSSSHAYSLPHRTLQLDEALSRLEQRGYSRAHRLLLFWVDGHRSIPELMNLVKCSEGEIHELLRDLELANVIQMPYAPPQR